MAKQRKKEILLLAEFDSPASLMQAAEKTRDAGFKNFDCHSPFPIHGMNEAMGIKRSSLGYIVGIFAFIGLTGGILLQWWTSSVAYPLVISGKPFFSYQAFLPVTFAFAVLLSAITSLVCMMAFNKLPRLNHPIFNSERFKKATDDGFFVSIEADSDKFDINKAKSFLESIGGKNAEVLGG